jgi:hypothetical protein
MTELFGRSPTYGLNEKTGIVHLCVAYDAEDRAYLQAAVVSGARYGLAGVCGSLFAGIVVPPLRPLTCLACIAREPSVRWTES